MVGAGKLIFLSNRSEARGHHAHRSGGDDLAGDRRYFTATRIPGVAQVFDWSSYFGDSKSLRNFAHDFHDPRMRMRMFVAVDVAGHNAGVANFLDLRGQFAFDVVGFDYSGGNASHEQRERVWQIAFGIEQ